MNKQRADEIERHVIYRHMSDLTFNLEQSNETHVIFHVGRIIGMICSDLKRELESEIERGGEVND